MDAVTVADMRKNDVAIVYVYPDKTLNYYESLYRVFWSELRQSRSDFNGIWDIDRDLIDAFVERFKSKGLSAKPIYSLLSNSDYQTLKQSFSGLPIIQHENSKPIPYHINKSLGDKVRSEGIEYVIVINGSSILVNANTIGGPVITMWNNINIQNLKTKEIEYSGIFRLGGDIGLSDRILTTKKKPREIEENKLIKVKIFLLKEIDEEFQEGKLAKDIGLL